VAALSAQSGQHPNTIREHLDRLSNGGLVVRTQAAAQGRGHPAGLYSAVRAVGSDHEAREYGADAIEAGRIWGRELVQGSQLRFPEVSRSAVATRRMVVDCAMLMITAGAVALAASGAQSRTVFFS
jgi:hypothetical protein